GRCPLNGCVLGANHAVPAGKIALIVERYLIGRIPAKKEIAARLAGCPTVDADLGPEARLPPRRFDSVVGPLNIHVVFGNIVFDGWLDENVVIGRPENSVLGCLYKLNIPYA